MFFPQLVGALRTDPDVFRGHAQRVREALRMADIGIEQACLYMDMDKGQFSRQLAGEGNLSLNRLMLLPAEFWCWYALLTAEDFGLPRRVAAMPTLADAINGRKQARMELPQESERRTA